MGSEMCIRDSSYPIYITHYPLIYTYTAWACNHNATIVEGLPYMILAFIGSFVVAYASLKLYDEPVRKWLTDRFLKRKHNQMELAIKEIPRCKK